MIGKKILHYKIIEKLGEGGMGVVYLAEDTRLERQVAIKFLPIHISSNSDERKRFEIEAKAAASLNHPNIATIHAIEEADDQIFLVMEYIPGKHLKNHINSKPLSINESIHIAIQIAEGMQAAHEKGIVHRDIKSANIMSTKDNKVKIMDFGLAKIGEGVQLTKEQSTLGTTSYMSPEQARGEKVDHRSDIWSLGIIFYEMLTGKLPFDGNYDQAVIYNIFNETPEPLNHLNKNVPSELNDIVQKCLEKDKDKRYQTVNEFYSDLIQVIKKYKYTIRMRSGLFQPAGLTGKKRILPPVLSAAAALIVASVLITILIFKPKSHYTGYEKAFFKRQFVKSREDSKKDRSLENVKAHRYYIHSAANAKIDMIPKEIKQEYRDLLVQNPDSPLAHYYLGLLYFLSAENLAEGDSVWILYDKAENLGLNDMYFKLDEFIFYKKNNFTQQARDVMSILSERFPENPDLMYEIGTFYRRTVSDTSKAREYYKNTLRLNNDFVSAHLGLMQLELQNSHFNSAKACIEKAERINREDFEVVQAKVRLYEREGRFNKAEEHLIMAINSFGMNNVKFYRLLSDLYQKQDLFEKCENLITDALEKFPDQSYFYHLRKTLKEREEWLEVQRKYKNNKNFIQWSEDYEESIEAATREKKPVLIEFYTTRSDWGKTLDEKTYPDPRVQAILKSYVPVRINADLRMDLADKYQINFYYALVIIDENGRKLDEVRYYLEPPGPQELIPDLNNGLELYEKYAEGASVGDEQITEVSNIKDALLLSRSKKMPVMAVFMSKESKWSDKLINETFNDPLLQPDLRHVIIVKVDQAVSKNVIKKWKINYFPSILFMNHEGDILYQVKGYQSPQALVDLIADLNLAMMQNTKLKDRIKWFHDLEEARSMAVLQKKEIFVFMNAEWCPYCRKVEKEVFTDRHFIATVNDHFVSVELNDKRDVELMHSFGIRSYPTFLILDASQTEITRYVGLDIQGLSNAIDLEERKPLYSILGQEKYQEYYKYENLSEKFHDEHYYLSAIKSSQKQIDIYSEDWQSYYRIAAAYLRLKKPGEMINYYTKAIEKGAEIDQGLAEEMLNGYLQLRDAPGFEKWFDNMTTSKIVNDNELANLYMAASEYYEIQRDRKSAILLAQKAVKINPDDSDWCTRLGRLYYLEDRLDEAEYYLNKALQIEQDVPENLFYLGLIADRNEDIAEKKHLFNLARNINSRINRGDRVGWRIYYQKRPNYFLYDGYLDIIEQAYRDRLKLNYNVNTKNDLAYFLATENRKLNEALSLVNQNLEERPDDVDFLDTKAVILYRQRKYQDAHETVLRYEDGITKNELEEDPSFSYYLGQIKWAVGDTVSAINYFNYTLNYKEPDAQGKRVQQELIKFMAE